MLSELAVCVAGPGELRETGRGELACGPDVAEGERREALRRAAEIGRASCRERVYDDV